MLFKGLVVGLLTAGALTVAACGGGGDDSKPASNSGASSSNTPAASAASPTTASTAPQVIEVMALENGQAYAFDKSEIRVKPGAVTIRYTNKADSQRPHTFDVKTKDGKDDLIKSDRVDPGKTIDINFTVTEEGNYQFICLLPGHADRGQKGTLIVSRS